MIGNPRVTGTIYCDPEYRKISEATPVWDGYISPPARLGRVAQDRENESLTSLAAIKWAINSLLTSSSSSGVQS